MIETKVVRSRMELEARTPQLYIHNTEHLNMKANFVLSMVERWGSVAGDDGGEDSQGRSKLKLQDEEKLVDRAIKIVDYSFKKFEENEWIITLPTIKEMQEISDKEKELA